MDDVFEVLDRTESTLGQHALYHRLRTSTSTHHLSAFEALVGCMQDSGVREPAQLALSRLGDPTDTISGGWRERTRSRSNGGTCCFRCSRRRPSPSSASR